ncbi:MAG: pilus assembly protein CpaE [Pseudomonadota bacterium]
MNAPSISIKPASEPVDFICRGYFCDADTKQLFEDALKDANWQNASVEDGGVQEAARRLAVEDSPEFLIIDLSESEDPRLEVSALAEVCEPGITVLAIGTVNDVGLYRDLLGSGIQDYLVKPLSAAMIGEALSYAEATLTQENEEEEAEAMPKRFCTFIGVRGGVGATTVATSIAYHVSTGHRRNAAFLDLDIHFGAAALTFDLEPGRGLCDAIENPGRVDSLFIERATIKQNERLSILGAEAPISNETPVDATALSHLQTELSTGFDFVGVDMPRNMLTDYGHLLTQDTDIVLVSDLSLIGARDTIRLLQYFKENAPKAKVHLVVNKVTNSAAEMTKADFEQSIDRKIDIVLPLDHKHAIEASKKGESILQASGTCKLSTGIKKLALRLSEPAVEQEKQNLLAKIGLGEMMKSKKPKAA